MSTLFILWMSFSRAIRLSDSDRHARDMRDSRPGASYASKRWFSPDSASLSHAVGVGGVVHDAECDEDGEKDVHQAVDFLRNVDLYKCFDAKDDEGGEGRPEGPRFEAILHVMYSSLFFCQIRYKLIVFFFAFVDRIAGCGMV